MAGLQASRSKIKSRKTQLTKWINGRHGIGDANAEALAEAFNALLGREVYSLDHFKNPDLPKTYGEAVQQNAELRAEIERLRNAS